MVDAESRERLGRVNERGGKFKVDVVPMDQLDLLEKNARYMTNEQFTNLVKNLKKDGELSSVPFCLKVGDRYRVLSGNHRVKAAMEAGIAEVLILYRDEPMTRDEEVATILSHNAISGQDDITLEKMEKLSLPPLSEIPLEYRQVTFVFLPEEAERLGAVVEEALDRVSGDEAYLARFGDYDRFLDTLEAVKKATGVKNAATAIMLMLEVLEKHMDELPGYIVPEEAPEEKQ
jgi:hypothetical protein